MGEFIQCLKGEVLKSRNSFAVGLSLVGTVANVLLFFSLELFRGPRVLTTDNPWNGYVQNHYAGIALMMLPLYVIILTSLVAFMEHRRQTWGQLLLLPVSRWNLYASKLAFTLGLFVVAHLLFIVGMLLSGGILGLVRPDSRLLTIGPDWSMIGQLARQTVVSILGLMALHYWLSLRFRHFIIPLTIGILGFVAVSLLGPDWTYLWLVPYGPPTQFMPALEGRVGAEAVWLSQWTSALYFVLFTAIGFWDWKRMRQV